MEDNRAFFAASSDNLAEYTLIDGGGYTLVAGAMTALLTIVQLAAMLRYDPAQRMTAQQALASSYFREDPAAQTKYYPETSRILGCLARNATYILSLC